MRGRTWGKISRRESTMRMSGLSLEDQPSSTMDVICGYKEAGAQKKMSGGVSGVSELTGWREGETRDGRGFHGGCRCGLLEGRGRHHIAWQDAAT